MTCHPHPGANGGPGQPPACTCGPPLVSHPQRRAVGDTASPPGHHQPPPPGWAHHPPAGTWADPRALCPGPTQLPMACRVGGPGLLGRPLSGVSQPASSCGPPTPTRAPPWTGWPPRSPSPWLQAVLQTLVSWAWGCPCTVSPAMGPAMCVSWFPGPWPHNHGVPQAAHGAGRGPDLRRGGPRGALLGRRGEPGGARAWGLHPGCLPGQECESWPCPGWAWCMGATPGVTALACCRNQAWGPERATCPLGGGQPRCRPSLPTGRRGPEHRARVAGPTGSSLSAVQGPLPGPSTDSLFSLPHVGPEYPRE